MINVNYLEGYLKVDHCIARELGLNTAVILAAIIKMHNYWEAMEELTDDGYFYLTVDTLEYMSTIGKKAQKKALEELERLRLIEIDYRGLPCKRYIRVNEVNMLDYHIYVYEDYDEFHQECERRCNELLSHGSHTQECPF